MLSVNMISNRTVQTYFDAIAEAGAVVDRETSLGISALPGSFF